MAAKIPSDYLGESEAIITKPKESPLALAGQAADVAATARVFADYRARKAPNTLARQHTGLAAFSHFLLDQVHVDVVPRDLECRPAAWRGTTCGLVEAFGKWLLLQGYAIGTVNGHLSTIKTYVRLAGRAGAVPADQVSRILQLRGYSRREGRHLDERRAAGGLRTRNGAKKSDPRLLTAGQARQLLQACPDTPQGRRDRLLLALLLEHGLRAGEAALLTVADVDLAGQCLRFFRPKVGKSQVHRLTAFSYAAAAAFLDQDALAVGPLLRGSNKSGALTTAGMTTRAITARVQRLGQEVLGIADLSAHDLRHTWATNAARAGTPVDRLQEAGGWSSPAMPLHYVAAARIANEGVVLEEESDAR